MKAIMTGAMLALAVTTAARAQSATPLTLSCTGTLTDNLANKVDKLWIGLIVNFQTKQVTIHLPLPEYGLPSARVRCGRRRIRSDRRRVCGRYLPCMRINASRQSDDRQNSR
jgi:hypothetical protein